MSVPLTVTPTTGDVSLSVEVRFAGGPGRDFVVDTGSSQSVVSSLVARRQPLRGTDLAQRQSTVCSVITVPLVHSGPWSVPGLALHPQLIGSTDFGISLSGTQGLLGSDQLRRYGWVILDYAGGQMVLGWGCHGSRQQGRQEHAVPGAPTDLVGGMARSTMPSLTQGRRRARREARRCPSRGSPACHCRRGTRPVP